ncbi:chromobox protein-like protein 3 [Platysternon megacephalum]|uniref:Chromobox protein-like protein 3 n=1 Tax=Platysternon megacephalum TaxID=55544 RepID=A0A4D9EAJ8_9SAUR|nr:chromobox protein-like protein 3 [Platysternon megacephalum]
MGIVTFTVFPVPSLSVLYTLRVHSNLHPKLLQRKSPHFATGVDHASWNFQCKGACYCGVCPAFGRRVSRGVWLQPPIPADAPIRIYPETLAAACSIAVRAYVYTFVDKEMYF